MTEEKRKLRKVKCLVFSRVVGFYTPVQNWNTGKQQEWKDRRTYDIPTTDQLADLDPALLSSVPRGAGPGQ